MVSNSETEITTRAAAAASPELVKQLFEPLRSLFGPSVEMAGQWLGLELLRLSASRILDIRDQLNRLLGERGITCPRELPLKLGVKIIHEALLEGQPNLKAVWIRLLANAADPSFVFPIHPAFVTCISELSVTDAKVLQVIWSSTLTKPRHSSAERSFQLHSELAKEASVSIEAYHASLDNLLRLNLVSTIGRHGIGSSREKFSDDHDAAATLTGFGLELVRACT